MSLPSSTPAQSSPSHDESEEETEDDEAVAAQMTFSPTDGTPLPHAPGAKRETER